MVITQPIRYLSFAAFIQKFKTTKRRVGSRLYPEIAGHKLP